MPGPTKRYSVRFGASHEVAVAAVPRDETELLRRAMALLEELRLADFMPEEYHVEHQALVRAWK